MSSSPHLRHVIHPLGYLQLVCLGTILAVAALRLPAQHLVFLEYEVKFTVISCDGGRFVFFDVIVATVLTLLQISVLRHPHRGTFRYVIALFVSAIGVILGLTLAGLGTWIGFFPDIPDDMHPSPGIASVVVVFAGVIYAGLAAWCATKLLALN